MAATHFSGPLYVGGVVVGPDSDGLVVEPTAATTLTAAQSGSLVVLSQAAGYAVTLPSPAAGLNYRFVVQALFGTTDWVITSAAADMYGTVMEAGVLQAVAGATTINLELGADTIGDYIDVYSDGTYWYVAGSTAQAASVTPA
jgi:hypothetical protein